jgi:hypothetical protein
MPKLNTDLLHESPFLISESLQFLPQATSIAQVRDWVYRGILPKSLRRREDVKNKDQHRVFLEVIQLSNGLGTSCAAYERFTEALNA